MFADSFSLLRQRALPSLASLEENVHQHDHAKPQPEDKVCPHDGEPAPDPKPLIGVEEPSYRERGQRRCDDRLSLAEFAQKEVGWLEHQLLDEVFPIDVDPPPEVREA